MPTRRRLLRMAAVLAVPLVVNYFVWYAWLSRRGEAWCQPRGFCGFLYILPHDTPHWYELHKACYVMFLPANEIDRNVFGGRYPVRSITFGWTK